MGWKLVLDQVALTTLFSAPPLERIKAVAWLEGLPKLGPVRGEVIQRDDQGRELQVLFRGDWMLTAWNDQATKEIRVVELVYV